MSPLRNLSLALACVTIINISALPLQGCQHDGGDFPDGSEVTMADPCVRCRCSRGSLVCRLRVCNPLPHPPPPGCIVLTRRTDCCPRLVCSQGLEELGQSRRRLSDAFSDGGNSLHGCTVNGTVYAEGSAMDSSTKCQYCYCIKGQQHCVIPQCLLSNSECTPTFSSESCCPTKYNCSQQSNDLATTTKRPKPGCDVEGQIYPEGELVPNKGQTCENCYCLSGRLHCEPVICSVPVNPQCLPVVTPGHCCPTSYNCSDDNSLLFEENQLFSEEEEGMIALNSHNHLHVNSERSITGMSKNPESKDHIVQTTLPIISGSTIADDETSTFLDMMTTMTDLTTEDDLVVTTETTTFETSATVEEGSTVVPSTTYNEGLTDVEERISLKEKGDLETTYTSEEVTVKYDLSLCNSTLFTNNTTNDTRSETSNKLYNGSGPNKSLPSEIEAILNKTKLANREEDYDYDYNEPSLPPSLPNLRIIPFVAADAVVDEPVYSPSPGNTGPHFYEIPHSNGFSPPAETEGGFLPKEPLLDGPFYESKYDTVYHSSGTALASGSMGLLPTITEPPKATEEVDKCVSGGRSYRHGELLTEPSACDLCVCYFGKILCQEPKCPIPEAGCRLVGNRKPGSCCRKIICDENNVESPTRVVENMTPAAHLPPFTVADVIVTPDPFRDVIRTEPAPDLPSLIGDIMPFLWDKTTTSTPVSLTTSATLDVKENNTDIIQSNNNPIAQSNTSAVTSISKVTNLKTTPATEITVISTLPSIPTLISKEQRNTSDITTNTPKENDNKEIDVEETNDDGFSLGSVFSYLFDSDKWTTQKPKTTSIKDENKIHYLKPSLIEGIKSNESMPLVEQYLENRSDEDATKLIEMVNITKAENISKTSTFQPLLEENNMQAVTEIMQLITKKLDSRKQMTSENSLANTTLKTLPKPPTSKPSSTVPTVSRPDPGAASGLLKLAGCNIYGRMYRVGRIISELSGPCLECMCTEVGVQCRPLKC